MGQIITENSSIEEKNKAFIALIKQAIEENQENICINLYNGWVPVYNKDLDDYDEIGFRFRTSSSEQALLYDCMGNSSPNSWIELSQIHWNEELKNLLDCLKLMENL